jgi:RimJ/RimL family protein N-acetyltransferase
MERVANATDQFLTKDGATVTIRPLTSDDVPHLLDLFAHMGPESRFLRFNITLANPDPDLVQREAERLAQVDPERDGAWLAFADLPGRPQAPIAGVRYIRLDDETAEASVAVRDDMQRKGIGTELLRYLMFAAHRAGVRRLVATVQRGNRHLWRLLAKAPIPIHKESEGSTTLLTADLSPLDDGVGPPA